MNKIINFMQSHINFGIQGVTIISIITAIAIAPFMMFLPEKCGWENGLLENIQMVVLFLGVFFALRPKTDKKFFHFF